jgi:hypothetical protein
MEYDLHQSECTSRIEYRRITPGGMKHSFFSKPISALMFFNPKGKA